ncbi:unnamed protein product [Phytophthora fragariaefolia]|uniref:Unnamed protein product n=1 Tax=Phytophthora fragariaefolia TaxID=1490495 RepID=A0A9W6YGB1_9STRA|nr:unnamed protein product [Phytophthora fragariaefolia]
MADVLSAVSSAPVEAILTSVEPEAASDEAKAVGVEGLDMAIATQLGDESCSPESAETVEAAEAEVTEAVAPVAVLETEPSEAQVDVPVVESVVAEAAVPAVAEQVVDADVESAVESLVTDVEVAAEMAAATQLGDESCAPESAETVEAAETNTSVCTGVVDDSDVVLRDVDMNAGKVGTMKTSSPTYEDFSVCVGLILPEVDEEVESILDDVITVLVAIDEVGRMKPDDIRAEEEALFEP